jgi:hypothetical protein
MIMPVHQRKIFLDSLIEEAEAVKKREDDATRNR